MSAWAIRNERRETRLFSALYIGERSYHIDKQEKSL